MKGPRARLLRRLSVVFTGIDVEDVAVDELGFVRRVKTIARGLIGEMPRDRAWALGHD